MEAKEERADGECYAMLAESAAIVRNHRKLRREICISRSIIAILLITSVAFGVILYTQHVHQSKNDENINKEKANETRTESQTADGALSDVETPLMSSLTINGTPTSAKANLAWKVYNNPLNDFEISEAVVIPREGRYRLSLMITYGEKTSEDRPDTLTHYIKVYLKSYPIPQTILTVSRTVYRKGIWSESVSAEVYYAFGKGDEIKVQSDNATLIDISGEGWTKNQLNIQFISKIN